MEGDCLTFRSSWTFRSLRLRGLKASMLFFLKQEYKDRIQGMKREPTCSSGRLVL